MVLGHYSTSIYLCEMRGKMQLVDREVHAKAGHTGGREIWGGGEEARKGKYRGE